MRLDFKKIYVPEAISENPRLGTWLGHLFNHIGLKKQERIMSKPLYKCNY